jgi:hypothetical protein
VFEGHAGDIEARIIRPAGSFECALSQNDGNRP